MTDTKTKYDSPKAVLLEIIPMSVIAQSQCVTINDWDAEEKWDDDLIIF